MIKADLVPEGRIGNKTFFLILVVSFLMFLSMYMLLPTLPLYAQTIGGNETVAGTIVGVFTLSAVLVRPWFGNLLDRRGSQRNICRGDGPWHWGGGRGSWFLNTKDGLRIHVWQLGWFCSVSIGYVLCFASQKTDPLRCDFITILWLTC